MHKDIEKKLDNKAESQTTILNSLVTLLQDMKAENNLTKTRSKEKKRKKEDIIT
jgi:mannitol/fructose-specific phosphotransferase system IIA component (Ntr-type)